jgi:ornithine carbamoyltransferase
VAGAVAAALGAELIVLSDIDQLRRDVNDPTSAVSTVSRSEINQLLETKAIVGGMIPKVAAALAALDGGARQCATRQWHASARLDADLERFPAHHGDHAMTTRHFVTIAETSHDDLEQICALALVPVAGDELRGQSLSLLFEKPSLRTRAAVVTAAQRLGAWVKEFSDEEIGLDSRESAEDVARVLTTTSDVVAARVRRHDVFERMRDVAPDVSYVNLLSDYAHPTQAIADALTLAKVFGGGDVTEVAGHTVTYVGDATNVTRSLATILVGFGVHVRVAAPSGYQLSSDDVAVIDSRSRGGSITLYDDPVESLRGSEVVYADSWVSMGLEHEAAQRLKDLAPYRVDEELLARAGVDPYVLHCLPAHRGEEITDGVLDSLRSLIWRQVHHRTTAMVGVLRWLKEKS